MDCTDNCQRISNNVTKWPNFQGVFDFNSNNQQSKQLFTTVCMSPLKKEKSLSLGRGKTGYEIRRVLRRTPTAEVAILTLFRDEHICSLAFEKSLKIRKVIWVRCALFPIRKTVARLNFCLHSTYNINSEALVNKLALLRATADGRCEKQLINRGGN